MPLISVALIQIHPLPARRKPAIKPTPKTPVAAPVTGSVSPTPRKVAAPSPAEKTKGATSAGDLLSKAFAQLSGRKLAIEEELKHTDDLRKELETINSQIESLKTALEAFQTSAPPHSSSQESASDESQEAQSEDASPFADSKQEFTGNKRELVTSIVDSRGSEGVTPKEIEGIFAKRKIAKGRNLIYNFLSLSVQRGKMRRENGKYFPVVRSASLSKKPSRSRAA